MQIFAFQITNMLFSLPKYACHMEHDLGKTFQATDFSWELFDRIKGWIEGKSWAQRILGDSSISLRAAQKPTVSRAFGTSYSQ